ncbi:hypothetical protein, partial [Nonomuraea wenchangensis]|uniref:hypothetical protein n=1 Tax=Nonomuraea wenchangensis TaxID=568860 RepID=UPI00341DBC80
MRHSYFDGQRRREPTAARRRHERAVLGKLPGHARRNVQHPVAPCHLRQPQPGKRRPRPLRHLPTLNLLRPSKPADTVSSGHL